MTCAHLRPLEDALTAAGFKETFRGHAWSTGSREWVYFDCCLARPGLRHRFGLAPCVVDHEHAGTHDGQEAGFVCTEHGDGVMGVHPSAARPETPSFPG